MAHFAKLDDNNRVLEVLVVSNDITIIDGVESEQAGIDFLTNLLGYSKWKQTSYNSNMRKRFAGIGYQYREDLDAFITPKPFASWTFNESTCDWDCPVSFPTDGKDYLWNETNQSWVETPAL
jgi:hypothetical protein